ncbi:MAG: 16S rRNA (cytosine(1402)-N(4))-methyltransferase RsmH [Dehalococcoidia bacterium]
MQSPRDTLFHTSVLLDEAIRYLAVQPGGRYVDCTVGAGGHARAILQESSPGGLVLGLDADPHAIAFARGSLEDYGDAVQLVNDNFRNLGTVAAEHNFTPVHGVLFDLGISSMQLAEDDRGFSFQQEAPLDMRFSDTQSVTAADIVNGYDQQALANLIWGYGEERFSRRIASAVVRVRPLNTTTELASLISRAIPHSPRSRIHPATRTFQALRIAVNDELTALSAGLEQARDILGAGGRIVVISFHSLEDRIVKQFFQRESRDCVCPPEQPTCTCEHRATLKVITKRPVSPSVSEAERNPRSRSAHLRAAERLSAES